MKSYLSTYLTSLARRSLKLDFDKLDEPIRAEIFTISRLEEHAESLARAQSIYTDGNRGKSIFPRWEENRRLLEKSYEILVAAVSEQRAVSPAAEWLIDNFHIVRAQIKDIHEHLPQSFYKELPKLNSGPLEGYPRVYGIAWAFVSHTDSRFDSLGLKSFLRAYQRVEPLTVGELWAIPITLRILLIENLRRLTTHIVGSQLARKRADELANELLGLSEDPARDIAAIINDAESYQPSDAFTVQLLQRLRFQEPDVDAVLEWMNQRFIRNQTTADILVSQEHSYQTAANASVRNIITSARLMSDLNWQDFFEEVSLVDEILRGFPVFSQMDFTTRDQYRHCIEELSRGSRLSEIALARLIGEKSKADGNREIGYFLLGDGRAGLESEIAFRPTFIFRLVRFYLRFATTIYPAFILLLTVLFDLLATRLALRDLESNWASVVLAAVLLMPASEIALAVVNRFTIGLIGPKTMPRLNLEQGEGVPAHLRTFVVVPTMLTDISKVGAQFEQLEVHFLSNAGQFVHFALLTDWTDSTSKTRSDDQGLLDCALEKVSALNQKYGPTADGLDRFFLFHRQRLFNKSEGKWMGWERKRGKLHELNQLLLGLEETSFITLDGVQVPTDVRYVVTLDADTRVPRGNVNQLVGTLAHPLNQGIYDESKKRVTKGYGILQPRVTPALPSAQESTVYQRLSTGTAGLDPYASAISDVYQDLFAEGSFTGKGIYDLRLFDQALKNRVPENSLLSHDLLEGNFARCGFLSDVEFFEEFPSHLGVALARSHRWTRGDWQLLPWIFGARGRPISLIGHWKMLDNLRRSILPMCFLAAGVLTLALAHAHPAAVFVLLFLSLVAPTLISTFIDLTRRHEHVPIWSHVTFLFGDLMTSASTVMLHFILLPAQAWMSGDAIVRALTRTFITRKNMLEWTTAAQAASASTLEVRRFISQMKGAWILSLLALVILAASNFQHLLVSLPVLILWAASPYLARSFSRPPPLRVLRPLQADDFQLLHSTARRTWLFFANFVNASEHFLPPDNFQEDPRPVVAHRSSPTNFGLYLLSVFAAHDFGWIGLFETATRLSQTLQSLDQLAKHEGHFFNWYDTSTLHPLEPRYISSVDNGNLAGHLLAVAQGCLQLIERDVPISGFNRGGLDTVLLFEKSLSAFSAHKDQAAIVSRLTQAFAELAQLLLTPDQLIADRASHWENLQSRSGKLVAEADRLKATHPAFAESELHLWSVALQSDVKSAADDFLHLARWTQFSDEVMPADFPLEIQNRWRDLASGLASTVALRSLPELSERLLLEIAVLKKLMTDAGFKAPHFFIELATALGAAGIHAKYLIIKLQSCFNQCHSLFRSMDFKLLYNSERKLFSIGMRVAEKTLDESYYDLLASEARLTSIVAIAKGDVPAAHWFRLGRSLTRVKNGSALVSWSGSMFEYLMPSIVLHTPEGSLLEQTCRLVIEKQIEYGLQKEIPWGISESAYNKRDLELTYQYSNFGVPALGFKRGLGANLVVAPYATILAAMYDSSAATANLRRLEAVGGVGAFGFYEAIDYTPARVPEGQTRALVKAYMAHHQGMSLVALANVFHNGIMRQRFHAEPLIQATELLLQERTPRKVATIQAASDVVRVDLVNETVEHAARLYHSYNRPIPTTLLLSNGHYTTMLTSAGSGYSRWRETALTRWREDVTKDSYGQYLFLKDRADGTTWSATYQPTCTKPDRYEVMFAEDRARFVREDNGITSELQIFVSPEESAEIRQLKLTNNGSTTREIEITSYAEVVLNSQASDVAHPAFSNLFISTEFVPELNALLATRRPRSEKDGPLWMLHVLLRDEYATGTVQYETDRASFIGRGQSIRNPSALQSARLAQTLGSVLDPVMSLRTSVKLEPGESTHLVFSNGFSQSREDALRLAEKLGDPANFERTSGLAWTQAQVKLHYLNIEPDEGHLFQRLATRLLYLDSSLRPSSEILKRNVKDVTGLWAHGISGDSPIILLRVDDLEDRGLVRQLLKAQEFLASKHFIADLVILNEKSSSYAQELQQMLESMVHSRSVSQSPVARSRGKSFVLRNDLLSIEDRILLVSEARMVLSSRMGSLSEQIQRARMAPAETPLVATIARGASVLPTPNLQYFNEIGGFSEDGSQYVTVLNGNVNTPAPWINVIAQAEFGFQISESGAGYTWAMNSRENQLTPWSNDPVCDPVGETLYIYDQDTGTCWTPTALPIRIPGATYIARHAQGYSQFEHQSHGIHSELTVFVDAHEPVKISRLKLKNVSRSNRNLIITGYVEWVLGFSRATMAPSTLTEFDENSQAIFAWNPRNNEHGQRVAFATFLGRVSSFTADRTEFIGRNGTMAAPHGVLWSESLQGKVGGGFDPCAAVQSTASLAAGEEIEFIFILGQASDRTHARKIISDLRLSGPQLRFTQVLQMWNGLLQKIQVKTPDRAFDLMINRWYLYQTIVCRFWARAAFYQAGGAFGFRDQLQDVMAIVVSAPLLARTHILRAASRQFTEGDVQHWWHPPFGRGVRTHFSDDRLWLPYVVAQYIRSTGDLTILDEMVTFLTGPLLGPEQEDSYYTPDVAVEPATLFEHCARAIEISMKTGVHGLPLMGCGDWNDGMNRIGRHGKGESVWLGWFLCNNLELFAPLALARGEAARSEGWLSHATQIKASVEKESWDGDWYRRAYFDDGTPVGSAANEECRIDSLTQTWAVISGAADSARARHAMEAVEKLLVRPADEMILLFTPPFDKTPLDPGYIKGYLPGVRENGGQYTHAASWCVIAMALLGEGDKALELFQILNPVRHGQTRSAIERYKVEPYVLAGDVYSEPPHIGRGGWSWYTGSSGWMYRAGYEFILGFEIEGAEFRLNPRIARNWPEYSIEYRTSSGTVRIIVYNPGGHSSGLMRAQLNGNEIRIAASYKLIDDGSDHTYEFWLGPAQMQKPVS